MNGLNGTEPSGPFMSVRSEAPDMRPNARRPESAGRFAPSVRVRHVPDPSARVVVRDGRVDCRTERTVRGVEVAVEPGGPDRVQLLVEQGHGDRLDAVVDELVRRIEYDAAVDAYYRVAANGGGAPVDFRSYLDRLERDLGDAAVEVAVDGFPA